jgi:hypothetical protein
VEERVGGHQLALARLRILEHRLRCGGIAALVERAGKLTAGDNLRKFVAAPVGVLNGLARPRLGPRKVAEDQVKVAEIAGDRCSVLPRALIDVTIE